MKTTLNIFILTLLGSFLFSSCANNKGEKALKELIEQEDYINNSIIEENVENIKLVEENNKVEVTFSNFLSAFPEKNIPFNLQDIKFTSYIETDFVLEYIDDEYLMKDSIELAEVNTYDDYMQLKYAYAAKINLKENYLLAFYQIRENIGPNGNYSLVTYNNDGAFLDKLNFDIFKVYLKGTDKVIIHNDSIEIKINNKKQIIYIDENGVFQK